MRPSTFKQNINSILRDNAITRYSHNQKKGKINTKRLYKIDMSEKIFKQKLERKGKDYSITTLIDLSGSTAGMRDDMLQAVDNFEQIFEELNIPTSIYLFSMVTRQAKLFDEKYVKRDVANLVKDFCGGANRTLYSDCTNCNTHDVDTYVHQAGDRQGNVIKEVRCKHCDRKVSQNRAGDGGTYDSEALYTVATQIHKKQKKNILIVLTDGSGDTNYSTMKYQTPTSPVTMKDIGSTQLVLKKLKRMYPELIVLAVPIAYRPDYCNQYYGKRNTEYARDAEQAYASVVKLIKRHIQRK